MTTTSQDAFNNAVRSMKTYDPDDYYPSGKLYDNLGKYEATRYEDSRRHHNLSTSLEMLENKLTSPRLRDLAIEMLRIRGFEDGGLKRLERSLLVIQVTIDDIKREEKELKIWKIQHRHLKDILCEVDDLLNDIALRAPQLKQLCLSKQVSHHPYLPDKLVIINKLIQELDAIAEEIKSVVLPEFNTSWPKSSAQSVRLHQSAEAFIHQDAFDSASHSMKSYDPDDYYPSSTVYGNLGKFKATNYEGTRWHYNLSTSLDMLKSKLNSNRLRNLAIDILWHRGFEDGVLRMLERSLLAIEILMDDIMREEKELKMWKVQHRQLKDLLCEIDDLLNDIALRAPQLKQLFQSRQVSLHPYLPDKLADINMLIQELDTISADIKSILLPEFSTHWPRTSGHKTRGNRTIDTSSEAPDINLREDSIGAKKSKEPTANANAVERPMFFAILRPQETSRNRAKNDLADNTDFKSRSNEEIGRKKIHTNSKGKSDDLPICDDDPSSSSNSGVLLSNTFTSIDNLPKHLKECLLYTSLFPRNYEFEKYTLAQMWIAVGCIPSQGNKLMEDTAGGYFDELLSMSLFQVSILDEARYTLEDDTYKLVHQYAASEYTRLENGNLNGITKGTLHSSILYESTVDPLIFKSFNKLEGLHSLLLLHESRKYIKQIPNDLISNLRCVRVLDVSRTQIKELPSSIGNIKTLIYLDLSGTLIKSLPQSVCSLSSLQILKLRDCFNFFELPKEMEKMTSLRYLELDIPRQLTFMPPRMGRLTSLQNLRAFIARKGRGSKIAELKKMVNLQGSLRIIKIENVVTVEDAEEAAIYDKQHLHRLELQWSLSSTDALDVLEGLQPHKNLRELEIVSYGGLTFPTWFGDSSFSKLTTISIYNCKNCTRLPLLGRLPSLVSLHISEMHALEKIDQHFCGGSKEKGFPKLETLDFNGMFSLEEWTTLQENGMPSLQKLTLVECPNLVKLPDLSNFKSLQHLEFSLCFKLSLSEEITMPSSLQTLIITDCPNMNEGCQKEGIDWNKIANVPSIWIDYKQIS